MNNSQIEHIVYNHDSGHDFHGVYAVDTLPSYPTIGKSYIINTDESHNPGEHWVAMYFPYDGFPEYFDSYGFPPLKDQFYTFLRAFPFFYYNNTTIQAPFSNVCGEYCIYYVTQRMSGLCANDILAVFDKSLPSLNDFLITRFIHNGDH